MQFICITLSLQETTTINHHFTLKVQAAAITEDTNPQAIGVNAASSSAVTTIKSASLNLTTYVTSTSGGTTETLVLGVNGNSIQNATIGGTKTTGDTLTITVYDAGLSGGHEAVTYTVQSSDTLATIATGIKSAINADTHLQALGVTATSASTTVSIASASTNLTTYLQSTSNSATETITLAMNMNGSQNAVIGGSKTTGDTVTINVYDAGLTSGQTSVNYTVLSGDTLTTIASGLASAINANTSLQAIGVGASSSSTVVTLNSNSVNVTSYSGSRSSGATETIVIGANPNGTQTAVIGGTKTTGNVLTITVYDAGLSGGSTAITYTVLSTDTLSTIAAGLATAINGSSSLSGIGVTATSISTVLNIKSTSNNLTTYAQSVSTGATETITLAPSMSTVQSLYNNLNELVSIQPGGAARFTGATNKAVQSASIGTQVISIVAPSPSPVTYSSSTNDGATETITFGTTINNKVTVTVGGTKTTGDVLTINAQGQFLPNGHSTSYTVLSSDTLTTIAAALSSAINADTTFQAEQITATSSGTTLTITANPPSYALVPGSTETMTAGPNINGNMTVTIGGKPTTGDTVKINVSAAGISSSPLSVSYTVLSTDTLASIASGLVNAFNTSSGLQPTGLTATNGNTYLNWSENFTGTGILPSGASATNVSAVDGASNTKTNSYQLSVSNRSSQSLTFDLNGNMTSDGTNTYQWDAENRLVQINYPGTGNNSQFTYDGLGHCAKIVETSGGSITSTKQFIWCDDDMCEARNASGTITAQYFAWGETIGGTSYYYTTDDLDSTRELTDTTGTIQALYQYDPYGRVTKIQGALDADFRYAGYYYHSQSGLCLTANRAYNPNLGRWINRDPIEEEGGVNLYDYVGNDPIDETDPNGTATLSMPRIPICQSPNKNQPRPSNPPRPPDDGKQPPEDDGGGGGWRRRWEYRRW